MTSQIISVTHQAETPTASQVCCFWTGIPRFHWWPC